MSQRRAARVNMANLSQNERWGGASAVSKAPHRIFLMRLITKEAKMNTRIMLSLCLRFWAKYYQLQLKDL